jgi:hypothetical protein
MLASSGEIAPPCGVPDPCADETGVGQHSGSQPATDEPDDFGVVHLLGHLAQQARVVQVVEEPDDVELGHPAISSADRLSHPRTASLALRPGRSLKLQGKK